MNQWLIKRIILFSQRFSLFSARGSYSYTVAPSKINGGIPDDFKRSETEFRDEATYALYLGSSERLIDGIRHKTVLDFGCGYGGRTVWYAQYAKFVEGIEVFPSMVNTANEYAAWKNIANVRFSLGEETKIADAGESFDVIISIDVLEHVKDPRLILAELYRVLKKDGLAIIIFTPYYAMFGHHLNYITLFPALHWFFKAQNLVDAINDLLEHHPRFKTSDVIKQPDPQMSYHGKRLCLPTLNGMTIKEYLQIIDGLGFEMLELNIVPILTGDFGFKRIGQTINNLLNRIPGLNEYFSRSLVSVLRK
jgi:ubiquinone/menaquinone biosynthesis C-methylase UbiE